MVSISGSRSAKEFYRLDPPGICPHGGSMRTKLSVLLAVLVACLCARQGEAQPSPSPIVWLPEEVQAVPEGAKVTLELDRPEYFLGENVLAHFVLENTGSKPFKISQGGDYRGSSRSLRFVVTATNEAGHETEDPDPHPMNLGGLEGTSEVKPGAKFTVSIPLVRYRKFDAPGRYTIRVSHDLGWREEPGGPKRPVAEASVTFHMPTPEQAETVVAGMEAMKEDPGVSQGQRSPDYPDFGALRQPVYLLALERRAEQGNDAALEGIGNMETLDATAALIKRACEPGNPLALEAAQTLNNRLPDPEFAGKLPGRGPFNTSRLEDRRRLSQRCWDDKFIPEVRALAKRLLGASDQSKGGTIRHTTRTMWGSMTRDVGDQIGTGAFMIEAVGMPEDAPAVLGAMLPVLEQTMTPRTEPKDNILNDPEPLPELLRAMAALHKRGYSMGPNFSGNAELLLYFTWLADQPPPRPENWQQCFEAFGTSSPYAIREAVLRSAPLPLPEACVPGVRAALADKDLGVCRAACELVGKSNDQRFLAPLLEIIATENHEWLLGSATNAAVRLGAGYELLHIWAERLGDEHLYGQALDCLQGVLDMKTYGSSGRTDLSRAERLHLREVWLAFLDHHEKELRAGKRFKLDDPAVQPELFGRARQLNLADGSRWPPDRTTKP